ncbi:MAG: hypothetical protein LBQ12_12230 [Deltaproteobacteria bacterium]|jgi:hypothetical protein|nr:hypothetical protein [Deltaproteobacteria bacterium]
MRKLTFAAAIAAAIALSQAGPLSAQWIEPEEGTFFAKAARPEGLSPVASQESVTAGNCPQSAFPVRASYPQGFDGGGPVDQAVKAKAGEFFSNAVKEAEDFLKGLETCVALEYLEYDLASGPFKPSSKAFSVLFLWNVNTGGAHPSFGYASMNLGPDGRELTAAGLFADPAKSLPLLWARIVKDTCTGGHETAPSYYGSPECPGAAATLPSQLAPDATLDGMGHAVLTSLGITFNLDPYDGWSWAEGPVNLDIPKDDLVAMGASPELWE